MGINVSLAILIVALVALALRGGLQRSPIDVVHAGLVGRQQEVPIVLNSPFTIVKSLGLKRLPDRYFFSEADAKQIFNPLHQFPTAEFERKNVVVILLESFSKEYTALGGGRSCTPFLDSLMKQALVFTNGFANCTKSIEGIPAVLCSLPSYMDQPFINSVYANNRQTSFATLLKPEGYSTAFFHGGFNGTMNFAEWARPAGYDRYFGKDEFGNDEEYDGFWGIRDEPFLQFTALKLSEMKEPLHAAIFTLSSHHPYLIPDFYKKKYADRSKLEAALLYSDHALAKFFETSSAQPWFRNTLFVLTADHAGIQEKNYVPDPISNFKIPILLYSSDNALIGRENKLFSQIDILPEVMRTLHYKKPFFAFGTPRNEQQERISMWYKEGVYHVYTDSLVYYYKDTMPADAYNFIRDKPLQKNIRGKFPETEVAVKKKFRAFLQTYNWALNHDKMAAGLE